MRRSVRHKQDPVLFSFFKEEIAHLQRLEDKGEIDLYYYDETGLNLNSVVPYGWQLIGQTHRLSSVPSRTHTLVGFMNRKCEFEGFRFEGAATTDTTIACFESFLESKDPQRTTIVLLDNASIHTSIRMKQKQREWTDKQLYLQFLPAYCPELNLIERLWKELKYVWLDQPCYFEDWHQLGHAIDSIVKGIGSKYTVNFR